MAILRPSISIIILNVDGLSSPIKRHRVVHGIKQKKDPTISCLQKPHLRFKDTYRLEKNNENYIL